MSYRNKTLFAGASLAAALVMVTAAGAQTTTSGAAAYGATTATPQEGATSAGGSRLGAKDAPPTTQVQVMRATELIGTDVLSSDGRKVGDIVDYVFDTRAPRLDYVLVMTGGFLDIGGSTRAVPAPALSLADGTAHVRITHDQFLQLPKVEGTRTDFLSNPQNVATIDRAFGLNQPTSDATNGQLLAFSTLRRADAASPQDGRLGYIDDAWISLNRDRAPFIEITPTLNPFELPGKTRYAIPMAKLQPGQSQDRSYTFAVTAADLQKANPVDEAPGVQMVDNGFFGNQVLRVTVVKARSEHASARAGEPTGFPNGRRPGDRPAGD